MAGAPYFQKKVLSVFNELIFAQPVCRSATILAFQVGGMRYWVDFINLFSFRFSRQYYGTKSQQFF
jgi:hypothetical protein